MDEVGKCRESRRYQGNGIEIHTSYELRTVLTKTGNPLLKQRNGHLRWHNDNFVLSGRSFFVVHKGGDGHGGWLVAALEDYQIYREEFK